MPIMDRRWTWGAYLFGALVVLASVLAFTYIYVSAEHTLYTWDFHEYSTRVETTYSDLTRSPLRALVEVYLSTSQEYNLLPTIPLLPLRKLLGPGRLAYELNIAAVLVVPFVMAVGWIGSLTIPGRRGPVFWTTVLIALATPFTWVAILRGFVDLGAATFIVLAIGLYIADPRLTRLWRPIAIGVLLAAAFLFRRPFAYDALAFGAAVGVLIITRAVLVGRAGLQPAIRGLVGDVLRSALVAVGGLVTFVAIGHRLLGRLLLQDTGALYASYDLPAGSVIAWFVSGFGWVVVVLAIAGFVALLRSRLDERVLFVAIYGLVALLLWSLAVGQEGPHYAVHFVLPVVIGLAGLVWTIWRAGPARLARPAIAAIALVLLLNFTAGLSNIVPGQGSVVRALVADPNPPLVRADYDEMIRLVGDLRRIAGTDKAVLVLGSTDGFSNDTVQIADDVSRGHDATPLFVLNNPHVDSRDTYPLSVLLAADYVVMPDPLPMTLPPASEGVERVVHDLFTSPSSVADAFRRLPNSYVLQAGTRVQLYERTRATTLPEAIAALAKMREYTPTVPGSQVPWVSVEGLAAKTSDPSGERPPIIQAGRNEQGQWVANSLIYIGADASTAINGTAEFLDRTCAGVRLRLSSIDGKLAGSATVQFELAPAGPPSFRIADLGADARDLLLAPEQLDPARPCESRITLTAEAGDKAGAKSLLVNDAQPSP